MQIGLHHLKRPGMTPSHCHVFFVLKLMRVYARVWPEMQAVAAMAITQIHTHRRNGHGSCRDGKGGALDASQPHSDQRCAQRRRRSEEELREHPGAFQFSTHRRGSTASPSPAPRGVDRSAPASAYAKSQPPHRLSRRAALAPCIPAQPRQPKPSIATKTQQADPQQSIARQAQRGPHIMA